jgi:alpha-L-fucosidase
MISRRELLRDAGLALAASGTSMFGAKNAAAVASHSPEDLRAHEIPLVSSSESSAGAMAPTAHLAPAIVDSIWQKASSRYDGPRTEILKRVERQVREGPFRSDWQSLATYKVPEWYKDAKVGIFIHWGLYCVPAFGSEQYPHAMYTAGSQVNKHHIATYGPLTKFGYKDFIPMLTAKGYDPSAWARLFRQAGARYVVPVFEHHDGFAMYDSALSDWTAAKMGPRRDLAGELVKAVRAAGLHVGASSHRIEHDWFMYPGRTIASDLNDPQFAAFYGPSHMQFALDEDADNFLEDWTYVSPEFVSDWLARGAEIVEKYHPELFYFDFWVGHPQVRPYLAQFAAYFYNEMVKRGSIGVVNYKLDAMHPTSAVLDLERGVLGNIHPEYWQNDTSISNKSWGYIQDDVFKTPEFIVHELIDVVSKNGNLLMNIGPRADGTIPEDVQKILLEIGAWLAVSGEAIYGTRPWTTFGEGPTEVVAGPVSDTKTHGFTANDFRFTSKGNAVYAIQMSWPAQPEAFIGAMGTIALGGRKVASISLLGADQKPQFRQQPEGLRIKLPAQAPCKYAYAFRIQF